MSDTVLLALAVCTSFVGVAWLSLAIDANWHRVHGSMLQQPAVRRMRSLGAAAVSTSLLLCLRVDHVSIACLVWFMSLAAGSLAVALLLAWRPRWLVVLG